MRFLFSFLFISAIVACKSDWLDIKVDKQQAVPTTYKDLQALLDDMSTSNGAVFSFGEVAADGHYVTDAVWASVSGVSFAKNLYLWRDDMPQYRDVNNWLLCYNKILYFNVVLDRLSKIEPQSLSDLNHWNHIRGQAIFLRANLFWWIAQHFAPPYSLLSKDEDGSGALPGIPLKLTSDVTERSTRSSLEQTYNQIIGDLKIALELLPATTPVPTRASKLSASGLLSRAYLSIEAYDSALKYADVCLATYSTLLNYNTLSTSSNFIGGFNTGNPEVIFHNVMYTSQVSNFVTSNYFIDTLLYNSYDSNDLRRVLFFRKSGNNILFKGNYFNSTSTPFCGIATDELYLIRAECLARKQDIINAMNTLNDLLRTRWRENEGVSTYVDLNASDVDEALRIILDERRKELILRGLRWSDLRRLNRDERFRITIRRVIEGKEYVLEPNSYRYTFPIPADVIELSGMKQNEGWE